MVEVKLHVTTTQSSPYPSDEISVQCLSMMALCSIPKLHRCSLASWNELLMPSSSYLDSNWKSTNSLGCTGRYVCFESGSDASLWTMISFGADSLGHETFHQQLWPFYCSSSLERVPYTFFVTLEWAFCFAWSVNEDLFFPWFVNLHFSILGKLAWDFFVILEICL